jgi:hypothetical protein
MGSFSSGMHFRLPRPSLEGLAKEVRNGVGYHPDENRDPGKLH